MFSLLVTLFALPSFAAAPAGFDRVLVPVLNPSRVISGANGSQFATNVGMYARNPVTYYPAPGEPGMIGTSNPSTTALPLWEQPGVVARGRFIFVEPGADFSIFADLESRNATGGQAATTPLPVVREAEAFDGFIRIGLLRFDSVFDSGTFPATFKGFRQRHTLRIYDFGTTGSRAMRVRFLPVVPVISGAVERTVFLTARDSDDPSYPYYFEANVEQLFGSRCGPHPSGLCGSFGAMIEIQPITGNEKYYAFVSTTENDTQHVTTYLPERAASGIE